RNFEINVLGTLNACQAFAGALRAGGGAVVNVSSQAALVSLPQQAAYTASKGAVTALTRSLAIDWAEHGVRVNAVAPGFTVTPMTEAFFENETFTRAAKGRIPLGRILEADEIASAIVFLASPMASAITGVVLPVAAGWTAGEPALPWWRTGSAGRGDGRRGRGSRGGSSACRSGSESCSTEAPRARSGS